MLENLIDSITIFVEHTKVALPILEFIVLLLLGVWVLNLFLGGRLLYLGILPRHPVGLLGIIFSPFLHANFNHLFYNIIPLIVLSDFILAQGLDCYIMVTATITLLSGFLVWCFGKKGLHVGASGLITGYWGWLVMNIYQGGSLLAIILGCISVYYFAAIFFGIFPSEKGVSWEGHLFGLVAGVLVSFIPNIGVFAPHFISFYS